MPEEGLSSAQVLDAVFEGLQERFGTTETIDLSEPMLVLVANDSDWHRTREGFMAYESFAVCRFGDQFWAVGRGQPRGSYPIEPFVGDLWGIKVGSGNVEDDSLLGLRAKFRTGFAFPGVWLIGRSNGLIGSGDRGFLEAIGDGLLDHEAQSLEDRRDVVSLGGGPIASQNQTWKPSIVDFLCDSIESHASKEEEVSSA